MMCALTLNSLSLELSMQIGNVAILLERGNETDHYDFLELYYRRWKSKEMAVLKDCEERNSTSGRRASETDVASEAWADEPSDAVAKSVTDDGRRDLVVSFATGMPDKKRLTPKERTGGNPQILDRPFFSRAWHPYDWYIRSGTEVSTNCALHSCVNTLIISHFVLSTISVTRDRCLSLLALRLCIGVY